MLEKAATFCLFSLALWMHRFISGNVFPNGMSTSVGHNKVSSNKLRLDRWLGRTRHPHGNVSDKLGVARLAATMWRVGEASAEMRNQ